MENQNQKNKTKQNKTKKQKQKQKRKKKKKNSNFIFILLLWKIVKEVFYILVYGDQLHIEPYNLIFYEIWAIFRPLGKQNTIHFWRKLHSLKKKKEMLKCFLWRFQDMK